MTLLTQCDTLGPDRSGDVHCVIECQECHGLYLLTRGFDISQPWVHGVGNTPSLPEVDPWLRVPQPARLDQYGTRRMDLFCRCEAR